MEANAEGLKLYLLLFTANKGIPPQPLARVASGGELSRIALVMQVMNAEKTESRCWSLTKLMSGSAVASAQVVGRQLADLSQHVQLTLYHSPNSSCCTIYQHLLVKNNKHIQQAALLLS